MTTWQVVSVVVAGPAGLAALLALTAHIEARFLAPEERAEKLHGVLQAACEPREVEEVAAGLARQALPPRGRWRRRWLWPARGPARPAVARPSARLQASRRAA